MKLYIVADAMLLWDKDGVMTVNRAFLRELSKYRVDYVICFAPAHFGCWMEDIEEAQEAWRYMANVLRFPSDCRVIVFKDGLDGDRLAADMKESGEVSGLWTENDADKAMCGRCGIRCFSDWESLESCGVRQFRLPQTVRSVLSAALQV